MMRTSEVVDQLPSLIADVYEAAGAMRRQGDEIAALAGQTQARWQVLSVLSEGEWTVPRAARRLGVTRQAVQQIVDALAAEELVVLIANPDHQRSRLVRLSDHGRRALTAIANEADDRHADIASALDPEDVKTARAVLRTLIAAAR